MRTIEEINELREGELVQVSGGISQEEFDNLPAGTRICVICGIYCDLHGIITGFVDDLASRHRLAANVIFDDGQTDLITPCEFVLE